jgi:cellulose synthase (UDP-forming)
MNQILFLIVGWKIPTWRGQQYSLALFPLWIKAVTSAVKNVYFGTKLGFVVTSKTRQGGVSWRPVWPQLVFMGLLVLASVWGLLRLSLGWTSDGGPILANVFWSCYDLVCLSVILEAITYQPEDEDTETALSLPTDPQASSAGLFGRAGAGRLA